MKCMKCGGENHPDQKVCLHCGARTPAGGGYYFEEKKIWRPSNKMIAIAAGGISALLLILLVVHILHVDPPQSVAKEWFDSLVSRRPAIAERYVSPNYDSNLSDRMMDIRAISDEAYTDVVAEDGKYSITKPTFDRNANPRMAALSIMVTHADGSTRQYDLRMVKVGRQWRIEDSQF